MKDHSIGLRNILKRADGAWLALIFSVNILGVPAMGLAQSPGEPVEQKRGSSGMTNNLPPNISSALNGDVESGEKQSFSVRTSDPDGDDVVLEFHDLPPGVR